MTDPLFTLQTPVAAAPVAATGQDTAGVVSAPEATPAVHLDITVYGQPGAQGSKRHIGNGVMIESSKKVKPWRQAVKHAAIDAMAAREGTGDPFAMLSGPLEVRIVVSFTRPAAHWRTGRNAHILRDTAPAAPISRALGDADKLARSCLDALTDAGVWNDDAQVARLVVDKVYPGTHPDALPVPGAVIRIRPVGGTR